MPFSRIESLKEKIDKKYDECNNRFFAECKEFNFYKFKVFYKDIFYDYKYGSEDSKNYGLAYINNLGVEVCPYCNIGYTFATPNKRLGEFDHFFSQDKYPIFALSFYNLIPVCHNCNHKKRENDLKLLSPFDSNLKYDTFKFFPKPKEQMGKFSIVLTNPNGKEKSALDALTNKDGLDLENVYEHISYVADNLYEKALFWNKYQLSSIKTLFDGESTIRESNLFNFLIDLRRAILADVSCSEKDYLKRSQSKILKDIADELGIF